MIINSGGGFFLFVCFLKSNWESERASASDFSLDAAGQLHVFIFTFIQHISLNLSSILCVVCLSFVFCLVPNDTNPVVISIPPFFQPHFGIELVGVLAPKHSTLWWVFLVVFTEKGHRCACITFTKCLTHLSSNTHPHTPKTCKTCPFV